MELEWVENDLGTGRQVLGADQYVRYEGGGRDLDGNFQSGAEQGLGTVAGKAGTGTRSGWSRDCEWDAGEATEKGQTRRAWQVRCEPPMLFRPQSGRLL